MQDNNRTITPNIVDFATLLQMMNTLVSRGKITQKQKEITAQRIAEQYELSPLYL